MRAPFAVLSIVGGLATAALGPAFIWRFVLHTRPGEWFDLWFGILVAQLMVTLCLLAVMGAVFAWRQTPERAWPLQGAPGLAVPGTDGFDVGHLASFVPVLPMGCLLLVMTYCQARHDADPNTKARVEPRLASALVPPSTAARKEAPPVVG